MSKCGNYVLVQGMSRNGHATPDRDLHWQVLLQEDTAVLCCALYLASGFATQYRNLAWQFDVTV